MSEKKRTIMLGFRSPVDGRLMREWVTGLGYDVVESLDDAINIDLVLMDSVTARRLMDKALELKRAAKYFLPILGCIHAGENVGRWLNAGFDDVIRLPATRDVWRARIEIMLRLRRQSEALGQKSEASLIYTLENMSDGFVSLDENWHYTYVNKKAGAMFGRKPQDLVGKHIWTEFPEGIGQPFYKNYYKAVETQKAICFEEYYPPWDRWFENRVVPSKKGLSIFFHDITDRKQAEDKLKEANQQLEASNKEIKKKETLANEARERAEESEKKFRTLVEESPIGIFLNDADGNATYINDKCSELVGAPMENALNLDWVPYIHNDDRERIKKSWAESISKRKSFSEDYRWVHPDGKVVWTHGDIVPVKDKNGNVIVYIGTLTDITERKQAEEELKASEERYRTIISNIPGGLIHIFDRDMKYVFNAGEELARLGLSNEFLVGKSIYEVLPADVANRVEAHYRRVFAGETVHFEGGYGNDYFSLTAAPLRNVKGEIANVLTLSVNITERKKAEEEILLLNKELDQRVKERTVQLEASNKELEAFSYSVSHDLRAPLRAIDGFTRILMEDYVEKLDDEGKRLGSIIQKNARKMGKLIDDLLAFSRLGRASMQFSGIDMKNMANAIYHEATGESERKRIKFSVADLPDAYGDTNMVRQVWMNLISNAIKFSSKREKAVISITGIQDDKNITYRISDNGAGFDMQYVNKIFDVFQRLHGEKEYPGTGVGLSLVQRIIHRHKGKIWAESKVDKGATFYFSLPNVQG